MEAAETIIETNIPVPTKKDSWKTKLDRLEVGESFSFPIERREYISFLISSKFHARTDKKFTTSSIGEPKGTARVWRLEDNV